MAIHSSQQSKKILITGASGFIGSSLIEKALEEGFEVYAGVRSSSNRQFLLDERIHFLEINFSDKRILTDQLKQFADKSGSFDYVIHNAGITKARNNKEFFTVNYLYTNHFVESLIESEQKLSKFVYISSLAAFGPGLGNAPVQGWQKPQPISSYGKSKLFSEEYLLSLDNFPYTIIRPTGVYGPKDKDFLVIIKMLQRNIEPYLGNKNQQVSFIHVHDLCNAVFLAMKSGLTKRSYFISDGLTYKISDFHGSAKQALNKKTISFNIPPSFIKPLAFISEIASNLNGSASVFTRERLKDYTASNWTVRDVMLKEELNFEPRYNLEAGLAQTIGWYKENGWL